MSNNERIQAILRETGALKNMDWYLGEPSTPGLGRSLRAVPILPRGFLFSAVEDSDGDWTLSSASVDTAGKPTDWFLITCVNREIQAVPVDLNDMPESVWMFTSVESLVQVVLQLYTEWTTPVS